MTRINDKIQENTNEDFATLSFGWVHASGSFLKYIVHTYTRARAKYKYVYIFTYYIYIHIMCVYIYIYTYT